MEIWFSVAQIWKNVAMILKGLQENILKLIAIIANKIVTVKHKGKKKIILKTPYTLPSLP